MARPWRIEFDGAYYHVLARGNEGRSIFYDDKDRMIFLDALENMNDRFEIQTYAFVLMSNHYHLLLKTELGNLSRAMQWLGLTYVRKFNNRHSRSGHLFQGRFKSILVENDTYMLELSCYIHRNPLRAGIVKRLIDYKWSSYPIYAYGRKGPDWLKTDLIFSFFPGVNPRQAYREKVQQYADEEKNVWEDFRHGVLIGTQQFVERIKSKYAHEMPHREVPQQRGLVGRLDAAGVFQQASQLLNCDIARIRQKGRLYGEEKKKRDLLVFLLWESGAYTNTEVGEFFCITYSAVSHIAKKVKMKIKAQSEFRNQYEFIKSQIKM